MAETYDMTVRKQIKVHPFPIAKGVTIAGKADADDADISLKRGTVLASSRNVDGEVIYKPCTNWTIYFPTLVVGTTAGTILTGQTSFGYISPLITEIGGNTGGGEIDLLDDDAVIVMEYASGKYKVTPSITTADDYQLETRRSDDDGSGWPVGVLLANLDIDSVDDVENVPVLVAGGISKDDLIYPSDADDDDAEAFAAALRYNGIFAR